MRAPTDKVNRGESLRRESRNGRALNKQENLVTYNLHNPQLEQSLKTMLWYPTRNALSVCFGFDDKISVWSINEITVIDFTIEKQ